ncbi:MAG: Gfo/Idh/MocA family oxidoreductase, partial [Tepidisphaeraceae bacterium]
MHPSHADRRQFLKQAATAAAGITFPTFVAASALGKDGATAPGDRINVGMIGAGMRGRQILPGFNGGESQLVALCDVYKPNLELAQALIQRKHSAARARGYRDFREMLGCADIDAVVVAAPDHWHAILTIEACKAGKDVYCEKPLAHTIGEGRAMVAAARRYGRVVTGGSQRVRGDYGRIADYVASGAIGAVREAYVGAGGPANDRPSPAEPVPPDLDWETFVGPAPFVSYSRARFSNWRDHSVFGGGALADWGAHFFGGVLYALQLDHTGPVEILPASKRDIVFKFANGTIVHREGPLRFIGDKGEAVVSKQIPAVSSPLRQYKGSRDIAGDWFYCIRTRERPFQDVEYAHRTSSMCYLTMIAMTLNRPLKWDAEKELFVGDEQ